MMQFGPIAFANPWLLLGLIALPAVWLIIRAIPPRAKRYLFPPVRLLRQLTSTDPPPQQTPPWLVALRLLLATALILAFAEPVWRPAVSPTVTGPILIVVDDGWIAAQHWRGRIAKIGEILQSARRDGRQVQLLRTTPIPAQGDQAPLVESGTLASADDVRRRLATLRPRAWLPDHEMTIDAVGRIDTQQFAAVHWLSNGQRYPGTDELGEVLGERGPLAVYANAPAHPPIALRPVQFDGVSFQLEATRPAREFPQNVTFQALAGDGRVLQSASALFEGGAETAAAKLDLPAGLRSEIDRFAIAGVNSAGTIEIVDIRNTIPAVGVVGTDVAQSAQPLRSGLYFIRRALEPDAQLQSGDIEVLLDGGISVLFLADAAGLLPDDVARLQAWVREDGGLLVRFAGPRMAEASQGDLVPVRLRSGQRAFGGSLSWEEPKGLAPFEESSPFYGLPLSEGIEIRRQILAVPSVDLAGKTWARLDDGTPIVTAEQRGRGRIVLFHTTANTDWSNLVLTGLFEAMLDRLLQLTRADLSAVTANSEGALALTSMMDGFGQFEAADPTIPPIPARGFGDIRAGPGHPPGLYGSRQAPFMLNIVNARGPVGPHFAFRERTGEVNQTYVDRPVRERQLGPALLLTALVLAALDLFASLVLRGFVRLPGLATGLLGAIVLAGLADPTSAQVRLNDDQVLEATRGTRLAYIRTGDTSIDQMSANGMRGLERIVQIRTAVNLSPAMGLQPSSPILKLFPLIYWPVPLDAQALTEEELSNLNDYLRSGGIVLFDSGVTDSVDRSRGLANPKARQALERLLGPLSLPSLASVDENHVLSKSFYLMNRFPGRISGRPVWVERRSVGDPVYVSSVIIGSHDWIKAWAIDENRMRFSVPNLEGGARQRELAFRFGVNVVMYALTGTYKDDQLHLPAVLERLGE